MGTGDGKMGSSALLYIPPGSERAMWKPNMDKEIWATVHDFKIAQVVKAWDHIRLAFSQPFHAGCPLHCNKLLMGFWCGPSWIIHAYIRH